MAYNRIHARRICNHPEYALFLASLPEFIGRWNSSALQRKIAQAQKLCAKYKKSSPEKFKVLSQALRSLLARVPVERSLERRRAVRKAAQLAQARRKAMPRAAGQTMPALEAAGFTASSAQTSAKVMPMQNAASVVSLGYSSSVGRRNQGKRDQKQG